ncbi:antibiotic biosynthesis monooxygenase family protein [Streptomyces sp. NPDC091383]|uniref:antibiotic biosynthesis monooxygenase family protein n=1 Tax=Streptomyces sp. NPDC091383 TaxID=3365996 RepID=UPI003815FAD9
MFVIVFRSRLTGQAGEEYRATDAALFERVRALAGDDLADFRTYTAEDGERLAVVRWRDGETLERWRRDPEHVAAKRRGHKEWFDYYEVTVAEVLRTSSGGVNGPLP